MLAEFMPVGSGFGSFDPVFRGFEPDSSLDVRFFNHAHNDLLELAISGGAIALLLLAVFVVWWIVRSWAAFRPYRNRARSALVARAGAIMIAILFLASLVDYPLRTPLMAAIFAVAAAWLARSDAPSGAGAREET
jgi:O-antigen ligase